MKLKTEAAKHLFKAVGLIDTPERWCKGAPQWGEARCAMGAIDDVGNQPTSALTLLRSALDAESIVEVNDHPDTTHDDIMMAFAMAITLAEAEAEQ